MLRRQLEVRSDGVELSAHQLQLLVVLADELKGRRRGGMSIVWVSGADVRWSAARVEGVRAVAAPDEP